MDQHLAGAVEDADVHGLHVAIDSAIVTVLAVVESHRSSSCAVAHLPCASLLIISRSRRVVACVECHTKHTAVERTFVQFYPTLLEVARRMGTLKPGF